MEKVLKGKPVAEKILEESSKEVTDLKKQGITPLLAIVRVGEKKADVGYEKSAIRTAQKAGVKVRKVTLDQKVGQDEYEEVIKNLNEDPLVHGILLLRPLPKSLDEEKASRLLSVDKDVDGTTEGSLAGVFTDSCLGFPPCTAQAVMEMLKYYKIDPQGKRATIIGRSLVVGKPLFMMLLRANATPTLCHTKTRALAGVCQEADILVAASGQREAYGKDYVRPGQVVIDVGINFNEKTGKMTGDMKYDEVLPIVGAITPVPGGVGSVTSSVLMSHVVLSAQRKMKGSTNS